MPMFDFPRPSHGVIIGTAVRRSMHLPSTWRLRLQRTPSLLGGLCRGLKLQPLRVLQRCGIQRNDGATGGAFGFDTEFGPAQPEDAVATVSTSLRHGYSA